MKRVRTLLILSFLAAVGLILMLRTPASRNVSQDSSGPLVVYCAAGIKPAVEPVARAYEKSFGTKVQIQYGGSGTLLSNLRLSGTGDLFIAADESYLQAAQTNGLLEEILPLAQITPVIAVRKGNPKQVQAVSDLLRVEVALANPDAAAVGRITRELLRQTGEWTALEPRVRVFKPTVNDVANDLKLGAVDAGIIWDATVRQYPELEVVEVPSLSAGRQQVSVGVLRCSRQPTAALRFARYLASRDRGQPEFIGAGYRTRPGDRWAQTPEVVLYSGGVNRHAIEETIARFEKREGARVTRVYNGCGILVSQIKSGQRPDAYFACDVSFLRDVAGWFEPAVNVSSTDMVFLVARGNPRSITRLKDLAAPGLRVGVANEQQSALGALTARLLRTQGLYDSVFPNVRVQTPTADLLVNQMRAGALDVAVVYAANTAQVRDLFTVVPVREPGALAIQPYAVGRSSDHAQLMERLLAAIRTEDSRRRFEAVGFHWAPGTN